MMFASVKNKTAFCLLIVTLFTSFFFARSVTVREPWIQPALMSNTDFHYGTLDSLIFVNNWLAEGSFQLYFNLYRYPDSVETPTFDKRFFYGSYPPGAHLPLYTMFKFLDFTGLVENIHEKREQQILLLILYNYLLHFFLVLMLGYMLFLVCRKIGFDNLNCTLLAIIPAIIQFHGVNDLYWHHLVYDPCYPAVMLPFVLYIFLEMLRITSASTRVLNIVRVMQPLVMFYGVLVQWFFVFVILTVYVMRMARKEICLPSSLRQVAQWLKQSFLFFIPSLLGLAFWLHRILYHLSQAGGSFFDAPISSTKTSILQVLLSRMGFDNQVMHHLQTSLITHMVSAHGITGIVMLILCFYIVIRKRKFIHERATNLMIALFIMLSVPCLIYHLIFIEHAATHEFFSATFRPALVISFVLLPIFILQILKKNYLLSAFCVFNKKNIAVVTSASLISSVLYAYTSIYNSSPITRRFSSPHYQHVIVGNFVRSNTSYHDVVFCQYHYADRSIFLGNLTAAYFYNKIIHYAHNLDYIYHKTKSIEKNFTVRILYYEWRRSEIEQLTAFLELQNITVDDIQKERIGGLLSFDGRKFLTWYDKTHECDTHPQRCVGKEL